MHLPAVESLPILEIAKARLSGAVDRLNPRSGSFAAYAYAFCDQHPISCWSFLNFNIIIPDP